VQELNEIIDETIKALEEMKRSGITHVEVSRATLEELDEPLLPREASQPKHPVPPAAPAAQNVEAKLKGIERRARTCVICKELARCRHSVVFGIGHPHAELMFVGEAPGADEDMQGEPFVGRAGQLLTRIIQAMGYERREVYITNVLKCRPPQNRTPLPDEVENCLPYLLSQIELIQPKVIVALGATALRALLDVQLGITKMRGHWYTFRGIPIMPTFHPAYLLRNPAAKKNVWDDMKAVLTKLGRKPPAAK
jgi:uracil-DNA glycosylase family 4